MRDYYIGGGHGTTPCANHQQRKYGMKIEKALALLVGKYNQCKDNPMIRKPVSYALYHTWKWCDRNEEEREANE